MVSRWRPQPGERSGLTRLVLLTSSSRRGDAGAAEATGIEAFLTKPVRQSALLDSLTTLMGSDPTIERPLITRHTAAEIRRRSRPHLLVVEDNIVNQKVACRTLEALGYRVDVAANGLEALEAAGRISYAAVFMDCQMPEMDGYTATAAIRAREGKVRTPIIAMTAGASSEDEARCLASGMDDYISKPVNRAALTRLLQRWIRVGPDQTEADGAALDEDALEQLHELAASDPGGIAELVGLFLRDARTRLDDAAVAANQDDFAQLSLTAHSLRGSSGNLGARAMAALCADLEGASESRDSAGARAVLTSIEVEFERAAAAMRGSFALPGQEGL